MMLYICVSIAGSIPVIFCFILWILQRQSYNFQLGKKLLLTAMVFYLFPFQLVKCLFPEQVVQALSLPVHVEEKQNFYKAVSVKSIFSPNESLWIPKWLLAILILWMCCVIMFAVYQVVKYRIDIRKLLAQSEKVLVDINGKPVEILVNKYIHTLYTVGFIKQSVIVPDGSLGHPCFSMFYEHENQHRRNHDSLMKLVCIVIICIHWINPIAILLLFLYSVTAEYVCDARATEGCTNEKKKAYARVLIEISTIDEPLSVIWRNNLSGSEKLMKRRIDYMIRRKGMMKKGLAIAALVITVFTSTSTILAYEPMMSTNEGTTEILSSSDFGTLSDIGIENDVYFGDSDYVCVYEDGTQVPVSEGASTYALCIHSLKDVVYYVHKSNSSGGCTVTAYNAKRCSKCGYLQLDSVIYTVTYTVCTHK